MGDVLMSTFNDRGVMTDLISFEQPELRQHVEYLYRILREGVELAHAVHRAESPEQVRDAKNRLIGILREIRNGLVGNPPPKTVCRDCGEETPLFFIVKDEVWLSVAGKKDWLCPECFEARLGRKMTPTDLKDCMWTREFQLGHRIFSGG